MTYGLSPMRRALYFILPLVFGLILTGIVVVDAAMTPHPEAQMHNVALPEDHNWILLDLSDAGQSMVGTQISINAGRTSFHVTAEDNPHYLFDLGDSDAVDNVEIFWPDGRAQRYGSIPINARYNITYPNTAMDSISQWFEMNGPLYRIGGFVLVGVLLILFAIRIVVWAERRTDSHGEVFMR